MVIDPIDRQLLLHLMRDGRTQTKVLAERVGLSAPAVGERVRRLEAAGVIQGYAARVDCAKLGFGLQAVVRVSAQADQGEALQSIFARTPEIVEVCQVTGEDSYVLRVMAQSVPHLQSVIDTLSLSVRLSTSIVLAAQSRLDSAVEQLLARRPA